MTASFRRNLIILRAGDSSLHQGWLQDSRRDFDILISYFGTRPDLHKSDADYYEMRPGTKWPCIGNLLTERSELVERYDAFWLPDDDLAADTETLNRMFALFHGFRLALAQPALTQDSYFSWPNLLQRSEYVLRFVSFVEVMAPIFSRVALKACLMTFGESRSGWGLDFAWPSLIEHTGPDAMAVLDATPVRHTRPVGGEIYRNHPEMDPRRELATILERYGITAAQTAAMQGFHGAVARIVTPTRRESLSLPRRAWNVLCHHRMK